MLLIVSKLPEQIHHATDFVFFTAEAANLILSSPASRMGGAYRGGLLLVAWDAEERALLYS